MKTDVKFGNTSDSSVKFCSEIRKNGKGCQGWRLYLKVVQIERILKTEVEFESTKVKHPNVDTTPTVDTLRCFKTELKP